MSPPPSRPALHIPLPPAMAPRFSDNHNHIIPKTPDQLQEQPPAMNPPPPPRQAYRVRRKRASAPAPFQIYEEPDVTSTDATDNIIPTIETSEPASDMSSPVLHATPSAHGLLAPLPALRRLVTPPKTPAPRLNDGFHPTGQHAHEWDLINDSNRPTFERTGSVGSSFSDSSVSSYGSSAFSLPNESCTSPESASTDPFMEDDYEGSEDKISFSPKEEGGSAKRIKTHNKGIKWTPEMDEHLWMTYMKYVSDPTLTPFKMLPGTAPPLGVCHRVAAKAKKTWTPKRATTPSNLDNIMASSPAPRGGSPDTIRPTDGSAGKDSKQPKWPRSESATRRRLRHLCKRKPFLACHYQRLLRTRSPSPFLSSSSVSHSSSSTVMAPTQQSSALSGRGTGLSLATSTAPSMQPDAVATEVSEGTEAAARPHSQRSRRPPDWFARIGRSQAHQKSASLQSGLGIGQIASRPATAQGLASPFDEDDAKAHMLHSMSNTKSLGRKEFDKKNGAGPSLDSPFQGVQGAPTMPRSLKRRFRADDEKKRIPVQNLFSEEPASSAQTVRHRGYSVGAVRTSEHLSSLFSSDGDSVMSDAPEAPVEPIKQTRAPSQVHRSAPRRFAEPTPRLGSPFTEAPQRNTFPRSYVPSPNNPQPFQQRLRELAVQHAREQGQQQSEDPF
ncbi:hypothetical protein MBLNU230_g0819t1 [Neophaeotheca triangularis]